MGKRQNYDLSYDNDSKDWLIRQQGAKRATGRFDTKTEAVKKASKIGHNQKPAQVRVRKEERAYGNDPYPPKG